MKLPMQSQRPPKLPNVTGSSRHPFDEALSRVYKARMKQFAPLLRTHELANQPPGSLKMHLPLPQAVRPIVTS